MEEVKEKKTGIMYGVNKSFEILKKEQSKRDKALAKPSLDKIRKDLPKTVSKKRLKPSAIKVALKKTIEIFQLITSEDEDEDENEKIELNKALIIQEEKEKEKLEEEKERLEREKEDEDLINCFTNHTTKKQKQKHVIKQKYSTKKKKPDKIGSKRKALLNYITGKNKQKTSEDTSKIIK